MKRNHWPSGRNGCINTVDMRNCSREPFVDESTSLTCRRIASSMQRFDLFCYLHVPDAVCGHCTVLSAHHSFLPPVAFIGTTTKAAVTYVCTFCHLMEPIGTNRCSDFGPALVTPCTCLDLRKSAVRCTSSSSGTTRVVYSAEIEAWMAQDMTGKLDGRG